jgi:hypothetical protein
VPSDPTITIAAQRRDTLQHGIELDVDVAGRYATTLWNVLIFGAFAALATHRVSRYRKHPIDRPAFTQPAI